MSINNEDKIYKRDNVYDLGIYQLLRECRKKKTREQYMAFIEEVLREIETRQIDRERDYDN